jgi:hypothetical protein
MTIEVGHPRWRDQLLDLFGLGRAGGSGPLTVLDDVMPVVVLTDPSSPEATRARGEDFFSCFGSSAALAGNASGLQLLNPAGSGYLVVVQGLLVQSAVAGAYAVFLGPSIVGGVSTFGTDGRDKNPGAVVNGWKEPVPLFDLTAQAAQVAFAAGNAGAVADGAQILAANTIVQALHQPFIVPPGLSLWCQCNVLNQAVTVNAWGYSRLADPAELT